MMKLAVLAILASVASMASADCVDCEASVRAFLDFTCSDNEIAYQNWYLSEIDPCPSEYKRSSSL